jgi:MFS family permease
MSIDPDPAVDARPSTFASLANEHYRPLFVSGTISFLAVQALVVARGWLANEITGSNTGLGLMYLSFGVAMLVSTPLAGVMADRLSKRNLVAATNAAIALTSLWLGLGVAFDFTRYWMLLVTSAVQGASFAIMIPSRTAMTVDLVGRQLLTNAIVLGQMSMNASRVVGPSLAGMAIGLAWFGLSGVFFTSAGLSVLAAVMVVRLPDRLNPAPAVQRSPLGDFMDGIRYVRAEHHVRRYLVTAVVVTMVAFPYIAFLPRVATELFGAGAGGFGVMSAVGAVGAVGASLVVARRSGHHELVRLHTVTGVMFAVGVAGLGFAPNYLVALVVLVIIGAASSSFQSMNGALVLGLSASVFHGRVQSLMMLAFSAFGIAALPLGMLADAVGLRQTLVGMGLVSLLVMALSLSGVKQGPLTSTSQEAT